MDGLNVSAGTNLGIQTESIRKADFDTDGLV